MIDLAIDVAGARADPYAVVPTLQWRLHLRERTGARVHALVLHVQVRIEPQRRRYTADEQAALVDLFGEPAQWATSLHPFVWAHIDTTSGGFDRETEIEVPMACTYDFEVTASKYLHALGPDGAAPVVLLFSGTVFTAGGQGFEAERVPWDLEATHRLPVSEWRAVTDRYWPGDGWLRLPRHRIDALRAFRSRRGLVSWEDTVDTLLKEAGEDG